MTTITTRSQSASRTLALTVGAGALIALTFVASARTWQHADQTAGPRQVAAPAQPADTSASLVSDTPVTGLAPTLFIVATEEGKQELYTKLEALGVRDYRYAILVLTPTADAGPRLLELNQLREANGLLPYEVNDLRGL
jgi:hypothetical protein